MATFSTTTHAAVIAEVWGDKILPAREAPRIISKRCLRIIDDITLGDIIHLPNVANIAAGNVSSDGTTTSTANTETDTTVTVNQWRSVGIDVPLNVWRQSGAYDLAAMYAPKLGYGVAIDIEDQLFDLDTATAITTSGGATQGTDGNGLGDVEITAALAVLDNAEVPDEDRSFMFHGNVLRDLRRIDKFTGSWSTGENPGAVATGRIGGQGKPSILLNFMGMVYGYPAWRSSRLNSGTSGRKNWLLQKEAIALALQKDISISELPVPRLAKHIVADAMFGTGVTRGDHAVILLS